MPSCKRTKKIMDYQPLLCSLYLNLWTVTKRDVFMKTCGLKYNSGVFRKPEGMKLEMVVYYRNNYIQKRNFDLHYRYTHVYTVNYEMV